LKRFVCSDVIPGCDGVFTGAGDQAVLDQVLDHAADEHGLVSPALPFIELVMTYTKPFTPAHPRQQLRLVRSVEPDRQWGSTNCHARSRLALDIAPSTGDDSRPRRVGSPATAPTGRSNVHPIRPLEPAPPVPAETRETNIALDMHVLAEAHRSHATAPTSHPDDSHYGQMLFEQLCGAQLPDPDAPPTTITVDPGRHDHVEQILWSACHAGLPLDRAVKLAAAIDELAMAAGRDTGQVRIRFWHHQNAVVCEVTDPGTVDDPMIGRGIGIGPHSPRDRAVRLAHELCDLVQVRSGCAGTTVRIHSWR